MKKIPFHIALYVVLTGAFTVLFYEYFYNVAMHYENITEPIIMVMILLTISIALVISYRKIEKPLSSPITTKGDNYLIGTGISPEKYKSIINSAVDGIITINSVGIITLFSRSSEIMFGYSQAEVTGKNISILMFDDHCLYHDLYLKSYHDTSISGIIGNGPRELKGKRKDSSSIDIEISINKIIGQKEIEYIGIVRDITERKKYEATLNENEEKYRQLFSAVTDAILIFDATNQKIIEANKAALILYGYSADEIRSLCYFDLIIGGLPENNFINFSLPSPLKKLPEIKHKKRSGSVFFVEVSFGKFRLNNNNMVCAAIRDITERKNNEIEIKNARDTAIQAYKAKSQFLANISHEIRTPMNGILGTLGLLAETNLNDEQNEYVKTAQVCGRNLMELFNDILCFSKLESGKLIFENIAFDIRKLINESIEIHMRAAHKKNIGIEISIDSKVPTLLIGDPTRVNQIITNLINNAIKYTKEGKISLYLSSNFLPGNRSLINFRIVDTGIGIHKEHHEHIFDSFSQGDDSTTRVFGGTGLGLSICKQLISKMGGNIELISSNNSGSTFWFELTFKISPSNNLSQNINVPGNNITTDFPLNILIVEDNLVNQKITSAILKKLKCKVDIANDGKEAIAAAMIKKYDIILMDCQMPIMDGYEATGNIREIDCPNNATPIIAVTANAMPGDDIKCIAAGMNDYIAKPINKNILISKIKTWGSASQPENINNDLNTKNTTHIINLQVADNEQIK